METLITEPFYSALFVGLGLVLVLLEVFVPSGGLLGLLSLGSLGLGVYGFFQQGEVLLAISGIVLSVGFIFAVLKFGLKRISFSGVLGPQVSSSVQEGLAALVGKDGVTLTPLRPAGMARIDGKKVDVVTTGGFIEKDCRVRVLEASGNRVVVGEIRRN
jgi:membrane-bound serine protease (ClpP class)